MEDDTGASLAAGDLDGTAIAFGTDLLGDMAPWQSRESALRAQVQQGWARAAQRHHNPSYRIE